VADSSLSTSFSPVSIIPIMFYSLISFSDHLLDRADVNTCFSTSV
jgi:hypothetical protein